MSRYSDVISFCGEFEMALKRHDKSENSDNSGDFKGIDKLYCCP